VGFFVENLYKKGEYKVRKKKTLKSNPVDAVISNLEKMIKHKGSERLIYRFGDTKFGREVISWGHDEVDVASDIGGAPRGKVVEVFGLESGGKSYLTLKLIAEAQKLGLKCFLADIEQSFDPVWAAKQGVNPDDLYIMNEAIPAEQALDVVDGVCRSGEFAVVVVDSTAALIPQKEIDSSVGDADYALLARAMSKGVKKIKQSCKIGNSICAFVNQVRNSMPKNGRGGELVTPGGKSLDFYADQRISVWPGGMLKAVGDSGEEEIIGKKSYIKFEKNKLGVPHKKCEIQIIFDETAMNPIVKLITLAKTYKLFNVRLGEYGVLNEIVEGDVKTKYYSTGANSFGELAHWVLSNGFIEDILDVMKDLVENEEEENRLKLIDKVVYELVETDENNEYVKKDLWISPLGDYSVPVDPDIAKLKQDSAGELPQDPPKNNDDDLLFGDEEDLEKDKN
jgi:recombination protein RecA